MNTFKIQLKIWKVKLRKSPIAKRPKGGLGRKENLKDLFKRSRCSKSENGKSGGEDILKIIQKTF